MSNLLGNALIIDDDPGIRDVISNFLEKRCEASFQSDCIKQAEEIIKDQNIELIILDIKLKNENGGELIKWLRDNEIDIPLVAISGHFTQDFLEKNEERIIMLPKPFSSKAFFDAVDLATGWVDGSEEEKDEHQYEENLKTTDFLKNLTKK